MSAFREPGTDPMRTGKEVGDASACGRRHRGVLSAPGCWLWHVAPGMARGDDTGLLGRLFRLGGNSSALIVRRSRPSAGSSDRSRRRPRSDRTATARSEASPPTARRSPSIGSGRLPVRGGPVDTRCCRRHRPSQPRSTPGLASAARSPTADPLLTRMALGRSNDGSQFGMFLQVFADGTVIDSEGVHHARTGRPEAARRADPGGRPLSRSRPLRRALDRLRRVRPRRRLRAAPGPAPGPLVLVLGQSPGLRPRGPAPPRHRSRTLQAKLSRQTTAAVPATGGRPGADAPG